LEPNLHRLISPAFASLSRYRVLMPRYAAESLRPKPPAGVTTDAGSNVFLIGFPFHDLRWQLLVASQAELLATEDQVMRGKNANLKIQ
jgi:hypothetical protein